MKDDNLAEKQISDSTAQLRSLPSVNALLKTPQGKILSEKIGLKQLTGLARAAIDNLRSELLRENSTGAKDLSRQELLLKAEKQLSESFDAENRRKFQRVINATGVIIHTNLGRSPLAESAKHAIAETASGFCTLEYDLETGTRGRRGRQVEEILCDMTGAENALVVNNCAAAALLVLSALSAGGEAIVSRGELVEIGGDFRVPDVMRQSGTKLVEVGTTNRTKIDDYADAITENTRLIARVHPSNYRIVGFTQTPSLTQLAELAREKNILLYEDAGSGALVDLSEYGLTDEPVIAESIAASADVVTFSGDKLLGGVQAGLIVGRAAMVQKLRKHPLYRALRVDKVSYAALGATLEIYRREAHRREIPVLRMLSQTKNDIEQRAKIFVEKFEKQSKELKTSSENFEPNALSLELIEGASAVGGGTAPLAELPTILISARRDELTTGDLERALRFNQPPIIGRISENKVLLDLRAVSADEEAEILSALLKLSVENDAAQKEENYH